jgi:hypothetical protein
MNFVPESNPKIRKLAREASRKIKALTNAHQSQLEEIYTDFRIQADAIRNGEASADSLKASSADTHPTTEVNQS